MDGHLHRWVLLAVLCSSIVCCILLRKYVLRGVKNGSEKGAAAKIIFAAAPLKLQYGLHKYFMVN